MSDKMGENNSKIKQVIIDEGLYEEGMSLEDMEQIYKTLNRSKRTANEENEYRELMSQTTINCSNIELIKTNVIEADKASQTDINLSLSREESATNSNENSETKSADDTSIMKNIEFNFNVPSAYKPITIEKQNKNIIPILYHQPFIRMLPTEKKIDIIKLYLRYERKKNSFNETNFVDQWGKPIIYIPKKDDTIEPQNQVPEAAENVSLEPVEPTDEKFMTLRSSRLVKRKNYKESDSDEECKSVESKKSKPNIDLRKSNTSPVQQKTNETPSLDEKIQQEKIDSDFELSPIITKRSKFDDGIVIYNKSTPISKPSEIPSTTLKWYSKTPEVSDRTNKLFDKLKEKEKKTNSQQIIDDMDEIFPLTNSNLQTEDTPKLKKGKSITKKKPAPKTRKKLNLRTTNEEQATSITSEVSTTNFYGKNKEDELDASNNNKCSTSMVQCPICSQPFSSSEIEYHASRCEQYDDSEGDSLCVICNSYIANAEMDAHKFNCLNKITEESKEKTCDKNKAKLGFLCDVCDTYVMHCSKIAHASNCNK